MNAGPRHLVMVSDAGAACGVEAFARLTAKRLGARSTTHVLGLHHTGLKRALRENDSVLFNFPIVAWKKKLIEPCLAALRARMLGRSVVVVLHEWADLDWKRRLALSPVCLLATAILFSAPEVAAQFAASPLSTFATKRHGLIPIPPNLVPSGTVTETTLSELLRAQRRAGRLILGQFGSIYPKKQSTRLLDVARALVGTGRDVGVVFVGSFIAGRDSVEADFYRYAEALGLRDRVLVTGYVEGAERLAGIFGQIDAFCYAFPEGLTARRASVLAAALSGKPVVVNAPRHRDGLRHHPLFAALIANRSIRIATCDADAETLAQAVMESLSGTRDSRMSLDAEIAGLWASIVAEIDKAVGDGELGKQRLSATAAR